VIKKIPDNTDDVSISLSVVVAAYNEEKYLEKALRSILAQEGINFEVVFVDDRSTDSTLMIAREIAANDYRLRVYQNPKKGKCSAFNFGVEMASGDYVCIFAGDDIMPQGSLRVRLDAISDHGVNVPVIGLSKLITMSDEKKFDGVIVPKAPGVGAMSGVSPLMNRKALAIVFPVPESLPNEDTWMELAALHLRQIKLVHSDVISCKWRVHSGNSINMMEPYDVYSSKIAARKNALKLFLDKFKDVLNESEKKSIEANIYCEQMRVKGSILGVLCSRVGIVDRLRALSITNSFLYQIRRSLYALLSGR
jgi:glycosyltransferase involved in cell wall biosynthesis